MPTGANMATSRNTHESLAGSPNVTLERCKGGDTQAQALLIERPYRDRRRAAAVQVRSERRDHALQPTALWMGLRASKRDWAIASARLRSKLSGSA
jgi:hypothetical protein